MNITITIDDILIKAHRDPVSATGTLIDELAYSAGEATQEDLWNIDSQIYAIDYTIEHYNYKEELLKNIKTYEQYSKLTGALNVPEAVNSNISKQNKHIGAFVALNYPDHFSVQLEEYTNKLKDEACNYYDSDFLNDYAPDFTKELQDAVDEQTAQDYREWLHGDRRDYAGVLFLIAKYYGASDALAYDEKTGDSVVFTFDDEYLTERLDYANYDSVPMKEATQEDSKNWLINEITTSINSRYEKNKAEQAKRKAERERLTAYKAEQQAIADAERKAKLEALNK